MEMNRRQFVGASVAAGAAAMAGGIALADEAHASSGERDQYDIVVVGAGASGVAAAVEAAQLGASVIVFEKLPTAGGNGQFTEGMFGAGTQIQADAGIEPITFRQVISSEQKFFNYRINNLLWKDLFEASADNIAWLVENGVEFSGVVDDYNGLGKVEAFHWFKDGNGANYINPMVAAAEAAGAEFVLDTPVTSLIVEDGRVTGVIATGEAGEELRIGAGAVILATGGYACNAEMMAERGHDITKADSTSLPGHDGDGLRMAVEAGANDVSRQRTFLRPLGTVGYSMFAPMSNFVHHGGPVLWVNQDGERYTNEACGAEVDGCNANAVDTQIKSYVVLSQEIIAALAEGAGYPDLGTDIADAAATCETGNVFTAETIRDLAEAMGLDAMSLEATVARYNGLVAQGEDEDFDKDSGLLVPLEEGPFYAFEQNFVYATSIGAIDTDRQMHALNIAGEPIPGLFAVGVDGCNLYRETYTINIPASCNANNCNSGRTAARAAVAELVLA